MDNNLITDRQNQVYIITESGQKLGPFNSHDIATMYMISENIKGTIQVLNENNQSLLLG